jgi:RNA-splicing ligase RtcB
MPDYEINVDATWDVVHEVYATSKDAIWEENPGVTKVIDEMLTKLSELNMIAEVEVEWAND